MPWLFVIAAIAALAWAAGGAAAPTTTTVANLSSMWATYIVVDTSKFSALGYTQQTMTAPFVAVPANIAQQMSTLHANVATAFVGTVPVFLAANISKRVWVGPTIQDETSNPPGTYVPFVVGASAPAGYVEVKA